MDMIRPDGRLTVEPLLNFIARATDQLPMEPFRQANTGSWSPNNGDNLRLTAAEAADFLGLEKRTVSRAREEGLSTLQADRWATRAGVHPVEIWGAAFYHDLVVAA